MQWNIAAECISVVFLCVIWTYSRKGSGLPTLKNKFFHGCLLVTALAMLSNIASTVMLNHISLFPLWMTRLVTDVYFLLTPLMGMVYFYYTAVVVYEERKNLPRFIYLSAIPGILYGLLVLVNPFTGLLFSVSAEGVYERGALISVTYIIFYLYCVGSMIFVLVKRNDLNREIYRILSVFPVIALLVIVIQQIYPNIVLSGSAATCALLIIYLHLQNKQISIDYLTNLPNRRELRNMISLLLRKPDKAHFAIIVISLREFRQVNDVYGRNGGDELLKLAGQYFSSLSEEIALYRFNGDEFAMFVREADEDKIADIAALVRERMKEPWRIREGLCTVSASLGMISCPESADTLEELLNGLEYAVAQAKQGTDLFYADRKIMEGLRRRQQIVDILKDKCRDSSFEMYYQPIIDVRTGRFLYAESLMRMNDTPLGPIYPSEFIPIAEASGLIVDITYRMLEMVCRFIRRLMDEGIEIDRIHVNFSAIQFSQNGLFEKVCAIIAEKKIPFSKIKIEFTESTMAENPRTVGEFTARVHEMGVQVGLDDFGTGYSNLHSVLDTPYDTVKLDKSLVWCSMGCARTLKLMRNITDTFHDLGINVVAEGVETLEQDAAVRESGIDQIQGYLYAKPMAEEETIRFLRKHNVDNISDIR